MKTIIVAVCSLSLLGGCLAGRPDHFYILSTQPSAQAGAAVASSTRTAAILQIILPSLVDRKEIIINGVDDSVSVLEHERWAAPLQDQVLATLARDIEQRRADLIVSDGRLGHDAGESLKIVVSVVRVYTRPGDRVAVDAQWRVDDPRHAKSGTDALHSGAFSAPLAAGYSAVPEALSVAIAQLADAVVATLPPA